MTKEEIIRGTLVNKWMERYRNPTMVSWRRVMRAMDEYAKQEAIAFAEWCLEKKIKKDELGLFAVKVPDCKTFTDLYQYWKDNVKQK